jgi:very-short-patch-repair endonuclease
MSQIFCGCCGNSVRIISCFDVVGISSRTDPRRCKVHGVELKYTPRHRRHCSETASNLEDILALHLLALEAPAYVRQHQVKFPGMRNPYRLDFAWLGPKVCAEVQGGIYINGAHTRPQGYAHDRRRMNRLVIAGWRVLEYTPEVVRSGDAAAEIVQFLKEIME